MLWKFVFCLVFGHCALCLSLCFRYPHPPHIAVDFGCLGAYSIRVLEDWAIDEDGLVRPFLTECTARATTESRAFK